jgi:citrate lyase subunit beta/citryl-CoA lyase
MTASIARARSFLFVPASRPERFAKALQAGADCIVLDLEDAVAPDQKAAARDQLAQSLPGFTREQLQRTLVRINAAGTPWQPEDLRLLGASIGQGLAGAMVPKAEGADTLNEVGAALGAGAQLVPLVESLGGLDALAEKTLQQQR